ncbi:hypothetical protein EC991_006141 [Linnemannia zychae]|nr:hypothetical protein EC991_006141 [Linnemannia zychae]
MATPLPSFKEACLAPDNWAPAVYLIGSPNPGVLEVYSIGLSDYKTIVVSKTADDTTRAWNPNLPKLCLPNPPEQVVSSYLMGITAIQLGDNASTFMAAFGNKGTPGNVAAVPGIASATKKAFTLNGAYGFIALYSVYTKNQWVAMRVNVTDAAAHTVGQTPVVNTSSESPTLAVGTYTSSYLSTGATTGYTITFDSSGNGMAYPVTGNATTTDTTGFLSYGKPTSFTSGIQLTNNSVPVTMSGTAYILDKSSSGTIVIYSITPRTSMKLTEVKASDSGTVPLGRKKHYNSGGGNSSDNEEAGIVPIGEPLQPQNIPLEKVNKLPEPASPFPQHMASPYPQHTAATPFPKPSTSTPYPSNIPAPFPEPMAAPYPQSMAPYPDQPAFPQPSHSDSQYVGNGHGAPMMGPGQQGNGSPYWSTQPPPSPLPGSTSQYASPTPQYPPSPRLNSRPY